LKGGWILLSHCSVGELHIPIVLLHPRTGVAFFQPSLEWTGELLPTFREQLAMAGFTSAYPGHLPLIHRRLRADDIPFLASILQESFAFEEPIDMADPSWPAAIQTLLAQTTQPPPPPLATPPLLVTPRPRWQARHVWPPVLAALLLGAVAGGFPLLSATWRPALPSSPDPAPKMARTPASPPSPGEDATRQASWPRLAAAALADSRTPEAVLLASAPDPWPSAEPEESMQPELPPAVTLLAQWQPTVAKALAADELVAPPFIDAPMAFTITAPLTRPDATPGLETVSSIGAEDSSVVLPPQPSPTVALVPPERVNARTVALPDTGERPPAPPQAADSALISTLLRRGEELLALGDISAARRFFERAEAAGSANAAVILAETYDPHTLYTLRTRGLQPDPVAALAWYRRAAALGAPVEQRIKTLEAGP
jgi:hypothetical protein